MRGSLPIDGRAKGSRADSPGLKMERPTIESTKSEAATAAETQPKRCPGRGEGFPSSSEEWARPARSPSRGASAPGSPRRTRHGPPAPRRHPRRARAPCRIPSIRARSCVGPRNDGRLRKAPLQLPLCLEEERLGGPLGNAQDVADLAVREAFDGEEEEGRPPPRIELLDAGFGFGQKSLLSNAETGGRFSNGSLTCTSFPPLQHLRRPFGRDRLKKEGRDPPSGLEQTVLHEKVGERTREPGTARNRDRSSSRG
jgi:hypothetical protein